jgi:hypothetical protein
MKKRKPLTLAQKQTKKELAVLRKRTPEEWVERINALPTEIIPHAARLVWWDWFALRMVSKRWPHLDAFLKFNTQEVEFTPLCEALITLGYPDGIARNRADNPQSH